MNKLKVGLAILSMSATLVGCSGSDEGGRYINNNESLDISEEGVVTHRAPLTDLSYTIEQYTIVEQDDESYAIDTEAGLVWSFTLHKDDLDYDMYMNEMDYYIETRGFEVEDTDETVQIWGHVDESMQQEMAIDFNETYRILQYTNEGVLLDGTLFVAAEDE